MGLYVEGGTFRWGGNQGCDDRCVRLLYLGKVCMKVRTNDYLRVCNGRQVTKFYENYEPAKLSLKKQQQQKKTPSHQFLDS